MPYIIPGGCPCSGGGDGALISAAQLTEQGHLIFTYDNGTTVDAGALLTDSQMGHINSGVADQDLGPGLVMQDGKLTMAISMKIGDDVTPIEDGVLTIPTADADTPGLVKLSDDFELNESGQIKLNAVNVQKLVVDDETELIIGG